jgi:hypothetical protein
MSALVKGMANGMKALIAIGGLEKGAYRGL